MGKTKNATTNGNSTETAVINQVPQEAKELESILEKYFSGSGYPLTVPATNKESKKAVHSITVYNSGLYFAVSMYARAIDMSSIQEIERVHGYKLHKFNMQTAALFFWKVSYLV